MYNVHPLGTVGSAAEVSQPPSLQLQHVQLVDDGCIAQDHQDPVRHHAGGVDDVVPLPTQV